MMHGMHRSSDARSLHIFSMAYVVQAWLKGMLNCGSDLVQVWLKSGSGLVWFRFGSGVVQVCDSTFYPLYLTDRKIYKSDSTSSCI